MASESYTCLNEVRSYRSLADGPRRRARRCGGEGHSGRTRRTRHRKRGYGKELSGGVWKGEVSGGAGLTQRPYYLSGPSLTAAAQLDLEMIMMGLNWTAASWEPLCSSQAPVRPHPGICQAPAWLQSGLVNAPVRLQQGFIEVPAGYKRDSIRDPPRIRPGFVQDSAGSAKAPALSVAPAGLQPGSIQAAGSFCWSLLPGRQITELCVESAVRFRCEEAR